MAKIYTDDLEGNPVGLIDLSLDVEEGQIFGLVGPNGSGKTTTLKLLLGLVFPTSGSGEIFGYPLGSLSYKERIGFVPEGPYFYDHLNAVELLRFYGSLFGMGGAELEDRIEDLLRIVGMWNRRERKTVNYSRGMLQRIALAQGLINDPDLILMDEPTAGLDPIGAIQMREVIRRLRDEGKTLFICSHLLKEMEPLCDSVAILNRGVVCRQGSMAELLGGEDGRYVASFRQLDEVCRQQLQSLAEQVEVEGEQYLATFADQHSAAAAGTAMIERGAELVQIAPQRLTLEDVFIEAVGGIPE